MDSEEWYDDDYDVWDYYWKGIAKYGERRYIDRPNYPSDPEF